MKENLFTGFAIPGPKHDDVTVRLDGLVGNLLLFDHITLDSIRLLEIPSMIEAFGPQSMLNLLNSRAVTIKCDANIPVVHGRTPNEARRPFSYTFSLLRATDYYEDHLKNGMDRIREMTNLAVRDKRGLVRALHHRIDHEAGGMFEANWPELVFLRAALGDMRSNSPMVLAALRDETKRRLGQDAPVSHLSISLEQIEEDTFVADTNAVAVLGVLPEAADEIVCQALLRLAVLSQVYAAMKRYDALASFDSTDYSLLDDRVSLFAQGFAPGSDFQQLRRVIDLQGLPDLSTLIEHRAINLDRIIEIRATDECIAFRHWLSSLDRATDEEVRDVLESFNTRVGQLIGSPVGRTIRVAVAAVAGLANLAAGIATSEADSLFAERLFPVPGPIAFIQKRLPSAINLD